MKAFLISLPVAFATCLAIIIGCFAGWEWLVENTTLTEREAGGFVLFILFVLGLLFYWMWSYNNREVSK